jgi:hypothetical protein
MKAKTFLKSFSIPLLVSTIMISTLFFNSCQKTKIGGVVVGRDTNNTSLALVDRFSDSAGILFKRSDQVNSFPTINNVGYPAAGVAINFDQLPFITHGFSASGKQVSYYNFDAHKNGNHTDVIYHFYHTGDTTNQILNQLAIVNSLPGEATYNDFWQIVKVVVPVDYVANTITSEDAIFSAKYPLIPTNVVVNCPIVPKGSTANLRVGGGSNQLVKGWYKDQLCFYFTFLEAPLVGQITVNGSDAPIDDIYVFFATSAGPGSGFKVEPGTTQAHNIVPSLPGDAAYSPLWTVSVLDNTFFDSIHSEADALQHVVAPNVALVNCPVAEIR